MTIADAVLAVVVVIAGIAGFRAGATKGLIFTSTASVGLVVGARIADQIHFNSGAGRQAVATVVLVGCGAIGLAGGQLLRAAPAPLAAQPQVPAIVRRRRRRRWEMAGRTAATLLVGAAGGFLIARATESDRTLADSTVVTVPETTAATTVPLTTVVHSTFPSTTASPSTVVTATTVAATSSSPAPTIAPLALSVTSPSDGTEVTSSRVTLIGTAEPGAVVKVGTVAVTAAADTTWRLVVRVAEGVNQIVVTDGRSSVTVTVVFNAPSTTTTPTTAPPPPPPTTTTIPVDTEPKP